MKSIVLIGALDTKGTEIAFLRAQIAARGPRVVVVDVGVFDHPFVPEVNRAEVAAAGGESIEALAAAGDRGRAVACMGRGAAVIADRLYRQGRLDAVVGVGGGAGTSVATSAMRALPIGVPKLMVSTLAGGDVASFVGTSDIVMIPAVVDISGLNRISREVFARTAAMAAAMADADVPSAGDLPVVAASMFGNTTKCVEVARRVLEEAGHEVLVFHATGVGGRTMEGLVGGGYVAGVLDVTTTEWADEIVGGVMAGGRSRLEAAARTGIPAIVAPGCVDMVNFWAPDTVPERFQGRRFYQHNANITLMRTTPEENVEIGRVMAEKLNGSTGPVAVYFPLRGFSVISEEGGPFHWPEADMALLESLKARLRRDIEVHEMPCAINAPEFAKAAAESLLGMMRGDGRSKGRERS